MEWTKPERKSPKTRQYARKWKAIARAKRYQAYIQAEARRANASLGGPSPVRVLYRSPKPDST